MDPLVAGVSFLLGVLTAGAGALFQAHLLEGRRERALRRALIAEVRENIQALTGTKPPVELRRSAWEAARATTMPRRAFDALVDAYLEADRFNSINAITTARFAASQTGVLPLSAASRYAPGPVLKAFEKALKELGEGSR